MSRHNFWTPLQASVDSEDEEVVTEVPPPKKDFVSPIKVLSHDTLYFHKLFKTLSIAKYAIKKLSIGIKILCETIEVFNTITKVLKEHNIQHFVHESKYKKPFKFIVHGLDGIPADDVKQELIALNYKCVNVKQIEKRYDGYLDTIYVIFFENGTVKLNDLRKNIKSLFHTIIKWDYQRKLKNKPIQCFNCQMYGHGERGCSVKTKCANCAGRHKTNECTNKDKIKCANCNEKHTSNDKTCKVREDFLKLRESIQAKNSRKRYSQREQHPSLNQNNSLHVGNFTRTHNAYPSLPNTQTPGPAIRREWPSYSNAASSSNLFSIEEISHLTLEIISNLKPCKSKDEQFQVITQLAVKYLYST